MKTCVIIPAYDVADTLKDLLASLRRKKLDVVVVDDGSSDQTLEIAKDEGANIIRHPENRGKGASLIDGFQWALTNGFEAVIAMDADGQHNPDEIQKLLSEVEKSGADVVVGNRMFNPRNMPLARWLTNRFMSNLLSRVCKQNIPDSQCGFRLIKSEVLRKINLISARYEIESEILIEAARANFKISSVPISAIYGAESSRISPLVDTFRFIRLLLRKNKGR